MPKCGAAVVHAGEPGALWLVLHSSACAGQSRAGVGCAGVVHAGRPEAPKH